MTRPLLCELHAHTTWSTGDFHRPEHLSSWKTLLPCARTERAVVAYLRSPAPAYLVRFEPAAGTPALAA